MPTLGLLRRRHHCQRLEIALSQKSIEVRRLGRDLESPIDEAQEAAEKYSPSVLTCGRNGDTSSAYA